MRDSVRVPAVSQPLVWPGIPAHVDSEFMDVDALLFQARLSKFLFRAGDETVM